MGQKLTSYAPATVVVVVVVAAVVIVVDVGVVGVAVVVVDDVVDVVIVPDMHHLLIRWMRTRGLFVSSLPSIVREVSFAWQWNFSIIEGMMIVLQ